MANLSFEGSTEEGWVALMHFPEPGAVEVTCFKGPRRPTTGEAMWALVDAIALEAAEYREVKAVAEARADADYYRRLEATEAAWMDRVEGQAE